MDNKNLKKDWLVNNGVVVFVAAILIAESALTNSKTQFMGINIGLPSNVGIGLSITSLILSSLLILSSMIKPIQEKIFEIASGFQYAFTIFAYLAFLLGLIQYLAELFVLVMEDYSDYKAVLWLIVVIVGVLVLVGLVSRNIEAGRILLGNSNKNADPADEE